MKLFHRWIGDMGADLGAAASGAASTPLVILHGLLGASDNWQTLGRKFAQDRPVLLVDQRNHGRSPHHPSHSYVDMAIDLLNLLDSLGLDRVDLLGHSMGGKVAMHFAERHSDRVRQLIVADIAPIAYEPHHATLFEALAGLDLKNATKRGEVDAQLAEKIAQPGVRMFLLKALYRLDGGGFGLRYNLPVLRQHLGEVSGNPTSHNGNRIEARTLAIYGGNSNYVTEEGKIAFIAKCTDLTMHCLPGAGHWLHAEDPEGFYEVVSAFLR